MVNSRIVRRLAWIGSPIVAAIAVVAFWNWNWFIPIVESQASSVIGRSVAISRLNVQLGRTISVTADGVSVANPPGWPSGDPPFIAISSFTVVVDAWRYLRGDGLILPMIGLDNPRVLIAETKEGTQNYRLETGQGTSDGSVKIGDLRIADGTVRVLVPKLNADFYARIATEGDSEAAKVTVDASGTYAAQPISARLVGGALLSLRDADHPWPVDLALANGPTRLALKGTVRDPVAFKGADVRLRLSGPDLGLLESLVGFPIPKTPAYQLAGKLDLDGLDKIRFDNFEGRIGSSDIAGSIEMQPSGTESKAKSRPAVTMDLKSNRVDLADLSGFIGGTPGRSTTENATAEQRAAAAKATASSKLLADTPISVPRLEWADIHLRYNGAHIEGRNMPLDNLTVVLDAVGGRLMLHPVSFGVGKGRLLANIDLVPVSSKNVHAKVDLRMQNLDVSRMMAATHTFEGAGSVSGVGAIDATGNSLASLMANGNGEMKMAMAGGDLSAVLIDLTGLHFGNALLSAMGVPNKTKVQCFVGDLVLKRGVLDFKTMTLDTGQGITNVGGSVDLSKETIDLALKTDAKHFSVGSVPTRINITGTFKDPSIRPGAEAAARVGAVAGLAALFAPLAILPTIQFGTSDAEDARCEQLLRQARASAGGKSLPSPAQGASADATKPKAGAKQP